MEQEKKEDEEYAYVSSLKITDSIKYLNLGILKHTVWTYVLSAANYSYSTRSWMQHHMLCQDYWFLLDMKEDFQF